MADTGFELTVAEGVANVRLARPEQHNSVGSADLAALRGALAEIGADATVRALLLTGTGERT